MAGLTQAQLVQLDEQGYVVVDNVLESEQDLAPVMAEYGEVLDGIARDLYAEGVLSSTYADLPFSQRLIQVCDESGQLFTQPFDISLPQSAERADAPMHTGPTVFNLLINARLLDCVESVMGPEILSNPIQHVRMKLPRHAVHTEGRNGLAQPTPWHQDNGVVVAEADETEMLTVWLPLNDATIENSCLNVVPYTHRDDMAVHCPGRRRPQDSGKACGPAECRAAAHAGRQRTFHAPQDHALLVRQYNPRRGAVEFRPALPADWTTHRPSALSRFCGT